MRPIFLEKHRVSPDRIVFLACALVAALWVTYEYGHYVGRAECFERPVPKVELRRT